MVATHPMVIRRNMLLLLVIAAMPFPASLLGHYGGIPIALAIYGAVNALATFMLIVLTRDVRRLGLLDPRAERTDTFERSREGWLNLVVFLLCIPAGYVLGSRGAFVLVLLIIPDRLALIGNLARRLRR